jgi:hypothetical protein
MVRKLNTTTEKPRAGQADADSPEAQAESIDRLVDRVRELLEQDQPHQALEAINESPAKSPRLSNARAVCQLRLGNPDRALEILRPLVVQGGIHLRAEVPTAFKLTFAAALLATGNIDGFNATLGEISPEEHPAVASYRDAYRRWRAGLGLWEKVKASFGAQLSQPFELDFPPGELA